MSNKRFLTQSNQCFNQGLIQIYVDYVNIWFASQTRNSFFNTFLFLILRKDRKAHFAIQGKVYICVQEHQTLFVQTTKFGKRIWEVGQPLSFTSASIQRRLHGAIRTTSVKSEGKFLPHRNGNLQSHTPSPFLVCLII